MQLTIIAYTDAHGTRIDRLAWSLGTIPPCEAFHLIVLDRTPDGDPGLAKKLAAYSAAFPWKVVRPATAGWYLSELVEGADVLGLPASAIPIGESLKMLYKQGRGGAAAAYCRTPGPLCVYGMDDLGTNLTNSAFEDCKPGDVPAWCCSKSIWGTKEEARQPSEVAFVIFPPFSQYDVTWNPNELVAA